MSESSIKIFFSYTEYQYYKRIKNKSEILKQFNLQIPAIVVTLKAIEKIKFNKPYTGNKRIIPEYFYMTCLAKNPDKNCSN